MRTPSIVLPLLGASAFLPCVGAFAETPLKATAGVHLRAASAAIGGDDVAPPTWGRMQLQQDLEGRSEAASAPLATWARSLLAGVAMVAVIAAGVPHAARAEGGSIDMYFGQGCFWHVQHELVKKEVGSLARSAEQVTALSGYAGGTQVGDKGRVCYHNFSRAPDYGQLGHTEVVNVSMPAEQVGAFAKEYFDAAAKYPLGRADPQDLGTEYRSALGLPGGMDGPLFKQIEAANSGRMELLRGKGNDADTVGTKKVWIYDSNEFPFHQGEVYHQFHDDMLERYSKEYHSMKNVLLENQTIKKVKCPEMGF